MKRIINIYRIAAMLLAFVALACQKEDYKFYKGEDYLQFGPELKWAGDVRRRLMDTLKRTTFYYDEPAIVRDTVYFDLYTVGQVVGYDRTYRLEQEIVVGQVNAVADVHYVGFQNTTMASVYVMKAGQYHVRVPIVLLRDKTLKQQEVMLKFKIADNENFKEGSVSNSWRKLIFSDKLSRPEAWDIAMEDYYLGKYSLRKHEFMIEVTGQLWNQAFFEEVVPLTSVMEYWIIILRRAVADYNRDHEEPLRDPETNELINF
ncbi:DUF4843 domain-containing protein [Sphingobacterium tabacisoli]|uniref:DUF4843 domain-containing protein n=1 Tax=Sphingobacterium tabacisoli TaxID=2044855 RepID=A0ABW5KZB7_9SPHI|nr:DUF4843 domain-containing protein [Sphingobacterium tabacisoli]